MVRRSDERPVRLPRIERDMEATKTIPEPETGQTQALVPSLRSPIDCKHHRTLFVEESRWSGDGGSGSNHVHICRDCGQFVVSGHRSGAHFRVEFTLATDECVEAAGRYAEFLKGSE